MGEKKHDGIKEGRVEMTLLGGGTTPEGIMSHPFRKGISFIAPSREPYYISLFMNFIFHCPPDLHSMCRDDNSYFD